MTMSEYEERFRPPAPSLHQTFAEVRGPNRGGSRSRRLWVSAALVGVMTITSKAALHHRYPRARGVYEWRSSRRGEPLPACRALFSRYERCFRRSPAPRHPPDHAGRSRNGDGGGGRVRDDWCGAHPIKRSAVLLVLTNPSPPPFLRICHSRRLSVKLELPDSLGL